MSRDEATGEAARSEPDGQVPATSRCKHVVLSAVQPAMRTGVLDGDTILALTAATDASADDDHRLGEYGGTIAVAGARRLMVTASTTAAVWLRGEAHGGRAVAEALMLVLPRAQRRNE